MDDAQDSEDDLLHKADALMDRFRVALPASSDSFPPVTPNPAEGPGMEAEPGPLPAPLSNDLEASPLPDMAIADDEVPLLTDVVEEQAALPELTAVVTPLEARESQLESALEEWLDHRLPEAVLRVLDGVADQLIAQIGQQARSDLLPRLKKALKAVPMPPTDAGEDRKDPDGQV